MSNVQPFYQGFDLGKGALRGVAPASSGIPVAGTFFQPMGSAAVLFI